MIPDNGRADLDALRRNSSSGGFQDQRHLTVRECIHERGRGLVQYILQASRHGKDVIPGICYARVTR